MLQVPVAQQILRPHDRDLQLPAGHMRELVLAPISSLRYGRYGYRSSDGDMSLRRSNRTRTRTRTARAGGGGGEF